MALSSGAAGVPKMRGSTLMQRRSFQQASQLVVTPFLPSSHEEARDGASITRKYELRECLGQGSAGVVYKARSCSGGKDVALKFTRTDDVELIAAARQEYELLRCIQHPHIIRAIDFESCSRGASLVMELFTGMTLTAAIKESVRGKLSEECAKNLFHKLIDAVGYLHECDIVHRDVKGDNILVSRDASELRLIDFNTAKRALLGGLLSATGTATYQPPEVLCGETLDKGSDVWASGLCLHLMLQGRLPFERLAMNASSREKFGQAIRARCVRTCGSRWIHISESCKHALRRCLETDPGQRATAAEVLDSDWLQASAEELTSVSARAAALTGGHVAAQEELVKSIVSKTRKTSVDQGQISIEKARFSHSLATCSTLDDFECATNFVSEASEYALDADCVSDGEDREVFH